MPKKQPPGKKATGPGLAKSTKKDARDKRARTPTSINLSGALATELPQHAYERCRHYFQFIATMQAIELLTKKLDPGSTLTALSGIEIKATDQIDDGFRSTDPDHTEFRADDAMVVNDQATAFTNVDAAHFCNLGVKAGFASNIDMANPQISALYEFAKTLAGNTRWLPQLVNIGPDRKIDVLHGKAAKTMLAQGGPTVTRKRIAEYVAMATLQLNDYIKYCQKRHRAGVAACAACYIVGYADDDFAGRVFAAVSGEVSGWCNATGNTDLEASLVARA